MKKRIIICVTCIAVAGIYAEAQNKSSAVTQAATATESLIAPPPPPPPPVPPVPPPTDGIDLPPVPPIPPIPPVPAVNDLAYDSPESVGPEIINNNGYEISIRNINGKAIVIVKKDGKKQKIKLSTWNADRKYYEKKYGQLPPPAPVVEEIEFTPPVIKKDN